MRKTKHSADLGKWNCSLRRLAFFYISFNQPIYSGGDRHTDYQSVET